MPKTSPKFLLSFDFDGTLINLVNDPQFHPALADVLRNLRKLGGIWVINTGRSLSQTLQGISQHNVFLFPDYIIAQECEIYRPGALKDWTDFGSWNSQAHKAHANFINDHRQFLQKTRDHVFTYSGAEFLLGDLGQVGIVANNNAQLDQICAFVDQHMQNESDIGYHRNGRYLRFSHSGYSKGTALRELARLLNLTPDRIFAAGDNYNDLSMLDPAIAHHLACPGNALPAVKQHLRKLGGFIATRDASEGMLEALHHFYQTPLPASFNFPPASSH